MVNCQRYLSLSLRTDLNGEFDFDQGLSLNGFLILGLSNIGWDAISSQFSGIVRVNPIRLNALTE